MSRHLSELGPSGGSNAAIDATKHSGLSLSSTANFAALRHGLRNLSFARRKGTDLVEQDTRGPFGLHLLHSPPEPVIDFVFVHGLRGGSIKTWCRDNDMRLYWPQTWLPRDPDLQNARIHSFGYNSDWGNTKDTSLDLHDFGRLLFGEMSMSPELRKGKQTPILLIGHSMGGLVIKKAYLLAQQDDRARSLADRIKCMFFLATPHRGSDTSKLLNNILRASTVLAPKQYITDLNRNSGAISVINDHFRFFADELHIWSFYETIKTRIGINSVMIVDRDSAVNGHKLEKINPLNADHRGICKFSSPSDPNYIFIRNSLVKATEDILGDVFDQKADEARVQINLLESYMHIANNPEDDLLTIESKKTKGSCEWLTHLDSFKHWRDATDDPLLYHWFSGQAGSGKSVLATHVIRHLQGLGVDTCYYFFRYGQKAQQTVSSLLRAIAFQMAILHPSVREFLYGMHEIGMKFDKDDERVIWRKIFANGILPIQIATVQYWIVDGLDECRDSEKLFPLLYKLESSFPIRILFSSRLLTELEKHFARFDERLEHHHIIIDDSRPDIQLFIENNSEDLPVEPENRPMLIEKLVQKSNGAFLWIDLVFERLVNVFSEEEIDEVLDQMLAGMAPLYNRILEGMAEATQHVKLIKALLDWTVCGTRPLSTDELNSALTLSLNSRIRSTGRVVRELCGQLLHVDKNNMVQMIHATARDFLLSEEPAGSVFRMNEQETNQHLAMVCLRYLTSDEMQPPRHPIMVSQQVSRSEFVDYACTAWSEHLVGSSSSSDELFFLVDRFFRTNVLSWVDYILSRKKNLYYLSRTSKNLRRYLDRRFEHASPLDEHYRNIEEWQVDLLRIMLKFGSNLLRDPSSIYFILPPLCPSNTSIHKQFGRFANGLQLVGLTNTAWDDCICYIDYKQSRALSLAGCDDMFAIGMKSGVIKLYQQTTCQQLALLDHGEPVKLLKFDNASLNLASAGYRYLKMWSIKGEMLWSVPHSSGLGCHLAALAFTDWDQGLVTVNKQSKIITWDTKDGTRYLKDGQIEGYQENPNFLKGKMQTILSADICPKAELLAIASRGRPAQIWSIQKDIMIGSCHLVADQPGMPIMSVSQVLFNPNSAVELLAVSYQDGELAIFDKWAVGKQNERISFSADALTLASTNDGRTLATGDAAGTIKFWDFETLTLLYCIKSSEHEVRSLAFSGDGFCLYDIRDTKTKVWEPSVLIRRTVTEESSISKSVAALPPIIGRNKEVVDIAQVLAPSEAGCIFAGRDDGSVVAYDLTTGEANSTLCPSRRGVIITSLSWNKVMIASADASYKVEAYALHSGSGPGRWMVDGKVFEKEFESPIRDIFLHPTGPWLLVFQIHSSTLINLTSETEYLLSAEGMNADFDAWLWLRLPSGSIQLLGAQGALIHIFSLEQIQNGRRHITWNLLSYDKLTCPAIRSMQSDKRGKYVAVNLDIALQDPDILSLLVYRIPHFPERQGEEEKTSQDPIVVLQGRDIHTFFGFHGDRIVFLDHNLWIQSVDLSKLDARPPDAAIRLDRHFFIPREFIGGNNGVNGTVAADGTIVFPKEGEFGMVRNALDWSFTGGISENHGVTGNRQGARTDRERTKGNG